MKFNVDMVMTKMLSGNTLAHGVARSSIVAATHMEHISLLIYAIYSCYAIVLGMHK